MHEKVAWISHDFTQPFRMQLHLTSYSVLKRSRLLVATAVPELYSIPHIISRSFYGPCHHAPRSINALSPSVCLFTPGSHPSNKFHPSPSLPSAHPRSQQLFAEYHMSPLGEEGRERGDKGEGKSYPNGKRTSLLSPPYPPLLSLLPPDCLGCVCYTAAGSPRGRGSRFNRIAWFRNSLNLCPFLHTCSALLSTALSSTMCCAVGY